jgi:hypothetical protein
MPLKPGDALGCIRVDGAGAAATQQGVALPVISQKRQMKHVGGFVEIQRRARVQLIVQGQSLRVHAVEAMLELFVLGTG